MTVKRLVLLRRMWNLDQKAMATAIGVSHRTWQRIEYSDTRITVDVLFKLAKVFQVSPGYFVKPCVPQNEAWVCLQCDCYNEPLTDDVFKNLQEKIWPLIETWRPALNNGFRDLESQSWPLCEISMESIDLNPAAQKLLNVPLSHYALCKMFDHKSKIALLFEGLLGDAPGKRYALCMLKPKFAASGRRTFVQLMRLQKRSWDNPRFLSVIVDAGPLEQDLASLKVAYGSSNIQKLNDISVILHPPVD